MAKHWYPVFSSEKCKQCKTCLSACPFEILKFNDSADSIPSLSDSDLCPVNCFKCAQACPNNAVGVIRPAKPCDCCSF
ncbi:4Fe-4S dicluster domain-containing protein [Methanimicrococcus blatticola]|uniref:2-oxoglutarate ferredoxin oxidoreductase subunit delta n=1 Tax=Methanimicrococcus blatticola TaxID=91560 RepID=A0A484F6E0_9EURY|nr:4Fe-4S dicluster domain-containing protein [Methanimicrococcus blatticola]MBZ3935862.1 4Fe-4S binding protein [Methanimicrococcus blatticola]MCC2508017.1 4Fe-4S binding protein [Methanimicrococcus blatticola]TDQ68900.1 2-oxoglutarate ferredoxin oxidoreductase subunit delta [Methanimicrococcus blatticola]